jgi:hypothetical protein
MRLVQGIDRPPGAASQGDALDRLAVGVEDVQRGAFFQHTWVRLNWPTADSHSADAATG